jgi:hypothetical protein
MILTGEDRRTRRKTCPSSSLFTTNPTWTGQDLNPVLCGERPATNKSLSWVASCHEIPSVYRTWQLLPVYWRASSKTEVLCVTFTVLRWWAVSSGWIAVSCACLAAQLLSTGQEKTPARNSTYAHAQDFAVGPNWRVATVHPESICSASTSKQHTTGTNLFTRRL